MAPAMSALVVGLALAPAAFGFAPAPRVTRTGRDLLRPLRMAGEDDPVKQATTKLEDSVGAGIDAVTGAIDDAKSTDPNAPTDSFTERDSREVTAAARGENELGYKWDRALPWSDEPTYRSFGVDLPGDAMFDPAGFADTKEKLLQFRDAEIKHCRLAMLGAAGWPLSELWNRKLAMAFNLPVTLADNSRAPSVLNGGLDNVSLIYWGGVLALAAAVELAGQNRDAPPGDFGFDPLGLSDKIGKEWVATAEIKNGRLAMIAIFAFAIQEFVSGVPVVKETPGFFVPANEALNQYQNSGYQ